jgi:CheY-like chemotaxis protein
MNAIIGLGHLLGKTELDAKQNDYVHKMQISSQSLLGIIDDILDFSKIEAGRVTIEVISFKLDDIFENLSILATTRIGDKPIEFLYDIDPDVPDVLQGDPYRIGQILTNLVSNAVKFTERGTIVVRVNALESDRKQVTLQFEVKDTGKGIDPDKLETLFEAFTQEDGSTTRRFGGTGLGLSISKQLCTLMGGSISAESWPGKGSLFSFRLRLPYGVLHGMPMPTPNVRGMKVLLVDDNPMAREVLGDMLRALTFKVTTLDSGEKALAALRQADADYDLVLLDWRMQGMNGDQAARQIHQEQGDDCPLIILMTAYGREMIDRDISEEALDGFLIKPITPSLLFDAIIQAQNSRELGNPVDVIRGEGPPLRPLQGHVLLVEDNDINQMVAREMLEQMGLEVDTVSDGEAALYQLAKGWPDLVLMDIQMPRMDGYQVTEKIRAMDKGDQLPIYAMTANALVGDADKSIEAGMNGHISKPVDPEELYLVLSKHLSATESLAVKTDDDVQSDSTPLPERLPGIDLQAGLKQIGGNREFYLKLLGEFVKKHGDCVVYLQSQLSSGIVDEARREAHTLKGVGGNIGAFPLQKAASALESLLIRNEMPSDEDMREFSSVCKTLFDSLRTLVPAGKENTLAASNADFRSGLDSLIRALEHGEAVSESLYGDLRPVLADRLSEKYLGQMDGLIEEYEFEQVASLLRNLIKD